MKDETFTLDLIKNGLINYYQIGEKEGFKLKEYHKKYCVLKNFMLMMRIKMQMKNHVTTIIIRLFYHRAYNIQKEI